jgi:hypothetical protein
MTRDRSLWFSERRTLADEESFVFEYTNNHWANLETTKRRRKRGEEDVQLQCKWEAWHEEGSCSSL